MDDKCLKRIDGIVNVSVLQAAMRNVQSLRNEIIVDGFSIDDADEYLRMMLRLEVQ